MSELNGFISESEVELDSYEIAIHRANEEYIYWKDKEKTWKTTPPYGSNQYKEKMLEIIEEIINKAHIQKQTVKKGEIMKLKRYDFNHSSILEWGKSKGIFE